MGVHRILLVSVVMHICYVNGREWIGCFSPQYAEHSSEGYIRCTFPSAFRAVYWYDDVSSEDANPFLSYDNSVKTGDGYERGEFDVLKNGTLVINTVRLKHEKLFKALCIDNDDIGRIFVVSLLLIVLPTEQHPLIGGCSFADPCLVHYNASGALRCDLNGMRPAPNLTWVITRDIGEDVLDSTKTIEIDVNNITYSVTTKTNALQREQSVLASVVCKANYGITGWKSETRALVDLSPTKDFNLNEPTLIYGELNGPITLPSPFERAEMDMLLWKKGNHKSSDVIAYAAFGTEKSIRDGVNVFVLDKDGSLTVQRVALKHEGLYTFVGSNGLQNNVSLIEVIVMIPPSPPYLIVKQCTTIHQCIIGRDRGTLTCATSGVRPLISVKWSTDENSGVRFSSAKSTSHDKMGLFDVLTEVEYVIEDYIECGARLQVTCHAFGQAAAIFQSTVNITIVKGSENCTNFASDVVPHSKSWIIPVVILAVFCCILTGFIVLGCSRRLGEQQKRKRGSLTPETGHPLLEGKGISGITGTNTTSSSNTKKKDKFISLLKSSYESRFDYDGIYIPPTLSYIQARKHPGDVIEPTPKPLKSYYEFFNTDSFLGHKKRIVIEGGTGYGKTFLALKMAQDWCRNENSSPLNDIDILILISLKGVDNIATIFYSIWKQLLREECGLKFDDVQEILQNEENCVLILDHYHEYQERKKNLKIKESFVDKILESEILPKAKVITLTAVQHKAHENIYSRNPPVVTIERFTKEQTRKYLEYIFQDKDSKRRQFEEKLQQNSYINDLCHIPLFLRMISTTFISNNKLRFEKLTVFFEDWFRIKLKYLKETKTLNLRFLKELTKLAYDGIVSNESVWSRKDFIQKVSVESFNHFERMGIIVETKYQIDDSTTEDDHSHKNDDNNNVKFIHAIYQQFVAAHYLAYDVNGIELKEILKGINLSKDSQMLVFICGLKKDHLKIVIDHLISLKEDNSTLPIEDYLFSCCYEADLTSSVKEIKNIFMKLHGIVFEQNDSVVVTKGKIDVIEKATEEKINIPYIAMRNALKEIQDEKVTLVCGSSFPLPKYVAKYFIDDRAGKWKSCDTGLLTLLEKTNSVKTAIVISRSRPEAMTDDCIQKLQLQTQMSVMWQTVESSNGSDEMMTSCPSVNTCHWMAFDQVCQSKVAANYVMREFQEILEEVENFYVDGSYETSGSSAKINKIKKKIVTTLKQEGPLDTQETCGAAANETTFKEMGGKLVFKQLINNTAFFGK
ncbi:hypothetical protein BSL78_21625 [Apostichopus japonicus]|uniref:Ig-like domain-containing protein n=1 Tax=Stichopus japonicus TaxID=307972 RepID=A0A2G8K0K2_STIJA|nr:hypothetical protein BSL78_21625 [Apostichopus japonicus]